MKKTRSFPMYMNESLERKAIKDEDKANFGFNYTILD